jgi:hypothetical protein
MTEAEYTNDFFLNATPDQIAALVNTLSVINSTLDKKGLSSGLTIVSAPPTTHPAVTCCGTILLQCTFTAPSSEPVIFVVHNTILWVHFLPMYVCMCNKKSKRVWEIDADKKTLRFDGRLDVSS